MFAKEFRAGHETLNFGDALASVVDRLIVYTR
jgi:hypothetical protein